MYSKEFNFNAFRHSVSSPMVFLLPYLTVKLIQARVWRVEILDASADSDTAACFEVNPVKLLKLSTPRGQQANNLDQTGMEKKLCRKKL